MQSISIYEYIWFGLHWRYLQDANEGSPIHEKTFVLYNIKIVLDNLTSFGLLVTQRAAQDLIALEKKLSIKPKDATLDKSEAFELNKIMIDLQRTLSAEALGRMAFVTTEKRINVDKLVNDVAGLFPPKVFDKLPEIAVYDFIEAGKCIAFERATAAAFHILRATEDVLRSFYCFKVKRGRVTPLLWGPMVTHLVRRRDTPPTVLLENLNNIRRSFRNPTQHPEKIYDIQEVQD